ncbi:unnamed protein product [Rotaria socialis]
MTSTEPKLVSTTERLTTYLVVNDNQLHHQLSQSWYQPLVEVPDHHIHKRVVFRNQAHWILEAIRLPGFSIGNQPILFSFNETNENYFKSSNTTSINISQQQPTPSVSFVFNTATIVPSSTGYIR